MFASQPTGTVASRPQPPYWSTGSLHGLSRHPHPGPDSQVVTRCNPSSLFPDHSTSFVFLFFGGKGRGRWGGGGRGLSLSPSLWVSSQGQMCGTDHWLLASLSSLSPVYFKTSRLQDFILVLRGQENILAITRMTNTNIHIGPDTDA